MQPSPKDTMATRYIAINEIREINDFQEKNSDRKSSHAIFYTTLWIKNERKELMT